MPANLPPWVRHYAVGFPGFTQHDGEKFVWDGLGLVILVVDSFFVDG